MKTIKQIKTKIVKITKQIEQAKGKGTLDVQGLVIVATLRWVLKTDKRN